MWHTLRRVFLSIGLGKGPKRDPLSVALVGNTSTNDAIVLFFSCIYAHRYSPTFCATQATNPEQAEESSGRWPQP